MTSPVFSPAFADDLDTLLAWRRDVRHFNATPLPDGTLDHLLDRACLAPSVGNSQPWRFVRVVSAERRNAIITHVEAENQRAAAIYQDEARAAYDALKLHGLREAPEHLAVFCELDPKAGRGLGRQTMPETLAYSVVMAIHTLWLSARAIGVGMGWVSIVDPAAVNGMLAVPEDWRFVAMLCLGYPAQDSETPELVRCHWQDRLPADQTRFIR
ncbi:5,6-dimethylbenzimidazole synthase [Novosphingobium sp. CECT 9465]|uniref:5,6-dimethylbenzimidazole synthase n=1 Tax=Novosphingobium sp. CECT 9465 TaxID=2829794 RepID=UPI001E3756BC|nr:5,6-dimethylbenzimidazole synthase [Novosphingobium sp. CECT 9465]CAH0495242.1 5,6-dimethylbenzimidazole synthase [Novosphingobium sp. CECT 9465]